MEIFYYNNETAKTIGQLRQIRAFIIKKIFLSLVVGFIIIVKRGLYTKENFLNAELPSVEAIADIISYAIVIFVVVSVFEYVYFLTYSTVGTAIISILALFAMLYLVSAFPSIINTAALACILFPTITDVLSIFLVPILVFYRKKFEGKHFAVTVPEEETDSVIENNEKYRLAKEKGEQGEKEIERVLLLLNEDENAVHGKILRNLYIPKRDGSTTEIDLAYITKYGIYIIESKNYKGWIFGREKDLYWTLTLSQNKKYRFYNPVQQNRNHIIHLHDIIGMDVPLFNFVVFTGKCEIKSCDVDGYRTRVLHIQSLSKEIASCANANQKAYLNDADIQNYWERLYPYSQVSEWQKQKHIADIRNRDRRRI